MSKFDSDRESMIERAMQAGVTRILVPGLNADSSEDALALADAYGLIYAAVGYHPTEVQDIQEGTLDRVGKLTQHPKVVAVGEIGLDYYWVEDAASRARQRNALQGQLTLASRSGLPVVLHMREEGDAEDGACARDLLAILKTWITSLRTENPRLSQRPGVLHSFSGGVTTALQAIELGFCIGVTGPVTYKNAPRRRQIVGRLPLDRILIETDSPFLAPEPHRGRRNEPAFVTYIADKIAEIQSRTPSEVAEVTSTNAARLFAWGDVA
jgi:TatD DNase family protein